MKFGMSLRYTLGRFLLIFHKNRIGQRSQTWRCLCSLNASCLSICVLYRLKHCELLSDLKNGILGTSIARVSTIEFQKRGLPHCHYLLITDLKNLSANDIDSIISAELPDPANPDTKPLHDLVKRYNTNSSDS